MADDTRNYGYRANDPYGRTPRAAPGAPPQGDPLAELARLIGQEAEPPSYRRNGEAAAYRDPAQPNAGWPQVSPDSVALHDYYAAQESHGQPDGYSARDYSEPSLQPGRPSGLSDPRYADPRVSDPRYADPSRADASRADPRYADPQVAQPPFDPSAGYTDPPLAPNSYPQGYPDSGYADPLAQDPRSGDPRYADPRLSDPRYRDPVPEPVSQGAGMNGYAEAHGYSSPQGYADPRYPAPAYDGQGYGAPPVAYPQDQAGYGNMPSFARPAGMSDSFYDQRSPSGMHMPVAEDHAPARRRGSIVTVLAVLALAVVGTAAAFGYRAMFGTAGTPVPPPVIKADPRPSKVVPVAGDPNAKPIQDRVGGDGERVVSREEAPIDPSRASNPRVIFPNLADQGQKPAAVAANVGSTGAAGPAEPKKIRTVAIRPDLPAAPAARNAPAEPQNAPLALAPAAQQPSSQAAPQRQQPQQQPPVQQQASRPVTSGAASAFPAPIAGGGGNAVAGAYAVQVTSQRSESDAQASYKSLQAQFPAVLGSRQPVIKKADLGDKGTYYRAQIPFQSQNEASEFCSSLKAAGGQCVVQKN